MIKLPFNLDMNAPLSKVIYQPNLQRKKKVKFPNSLLNTVNRIVTEKIRQALFNIKYQASKTPFIKNNQNKKTKLKTRMFRLLNMKITSRLSFFMYQLKVNCINIKKQQQQSLAQQSKKQTYQFILPIIQQRIKMYVWRKLVNYNKNRINKEKLVFQTVKTWENIKNRKIYSSAFLLIRLRSQYTTKKQLSLMKIVKILKQKKRFYSQIGFRKIQNFQQYLKLEDIHKQKKAKVNKIYDVNAERGNMLQNQRQILRNLKYKLDHDSVEKNHVLTDKRREIMLIKSKFNEESKQLQQEIKKLQSQTTILEFKINKQKYICQILQNNREKIKNFNFQKIAKDMYNIIVRTFLDGKLVTLIDIVKNHELNFQQNSPLSLKDIENSTEYQIKLIEILEEFIKYYERKQSISSSKVKSLNTKSQMGNITLNINNSRFSNVAPQTKRTFESQYQRAIDQNKAIFQLIKFLMEKQYEISIQNIEKM